MSPTLSWLRSTIGPAITVIRWPWAVANLMLRVWGLTPVILAWMVATSGAGTGLVMVLDCGGNPCAAAGGASGSIAAAATTVVTVKRLQDLMVSSGLWVIGRPATLDQRSTFH